MRCFWEPCPPPCTLKRTPPARVWRGSLSGTCFSAALGLLPGEHTWLPLTLLGTEPICSPRSRCLEQTQAHLGVEARGVGAW